ncbi:hypothetical protein HQQ80_21690 [Microbacteriaceae bacterium VKM Ac-2855]|nr:hypothetical protein [Microbacteriaceae bacterium VKM Ac-2855]
MTDRQPPNDHARELIELSRSSLGAELSDLLWDLWQNGRWFQQPVVEQMNGLGERYGKDQQDVWKAVLQLIIEDRHAKEQADR